MAQTILFEDGFLILAAFSCENKFSQKKSTRIKSACPGNCSAATCLTVVLPLSKVAKYRLSNAVNKRTFVCS